MYRFAFAGLIAAFVASGCGQVAGPPTIGQAQAAKEAELTPVSGIPVTLQLPNMVCGGCAAEVEKGLKSVAGIEAIKTDFNTHVCKFVVTDKTLDWQAKLAELAKDNSHLEDWTVVEAAPSTEKDL